MSRSIPYYHRIGYMYRVPRFDSEGNHIASITREEWLKENVSQNKHFKVYSICGELSSIEFIEMIANNSTYEKLCDSYEVIFGPKIESTKIKNDLKKLMIKNPRIKVYSNPVRPQNHGIKFADRLFCEEQHAPGTKYHYATIVERADIGVQNRFLADFNNLKEGSTEVTLENIDALETGI